MRPVLTDVRELVDRRIEESPDGRVPGAVVRELFQGVCDYLEDLEDRVEALE